MFDQLLAQMLQQGMRGQTTQRRVNAGLGGPPGAGGGMGELAEILMGRRTMPQSGGRAQVPGGDLGDILSQMLGGGPGAGGGYAPGQRAQQGGPLAGPRDAGYGPGRMPIPQQTRGGGYGPGLPFPAPQPRRSGGGGIGLGGMAVLGTLGMLAFKALQKAAAAKAPAGGAAGGGVSQAQTGPGVQIPWPPGGEAERPSIPPSPTQAGGGGVQWPEQAGGAWQGEPFQAPQAERPPVATRVGSRAEPPPPPQPAAPEPDGEATERAARAVLAAMINAAKADGRLDKTEIEKILGALSDGGANPAAQAFIREEAAKPFDLERIAAEVRDPQTAIEVYVGTLLAIEIDTPAEQDYVRRLAARLGLPAEVVQAIHQQVGAPAV